MKRPVKTVFTLTLCLSALLFAASPLYAQQTFKTTSQSVIGFLQYLPKDYASNSNKYPVVIFLHGLGERGANSTNPATLESSISLVAKLGPPKHVKYGAQFPFILISPQLKNNYGGWPSWYILEVIDYVKNTLRIDEKRIHITGLSLGGGGTWTAIQEFPKLFASAAPVCGSNNSTAKACGIAAENLPVWAFHGDADTTVPLGRSANMVNAINSCSPVPSPRAILTIYPGVRHNAWDRAYALDNTYHRPNYYEWITNHVNKKNGSNYIPSANAGSDVSISSGNKVTITGGGSDTDGSISMYKWSKVSGPSATLAPNNGILTASGLTAGNYVFKLQVTDNGGATDTDYVKVTIGSSSTGSTTTNAEPTVNAGSDVVLTLPSNSATLRGTATDSDGTIASFNWTKVSGSTASLSGTTTSNLGVSNLLAGTYVFRLTVKDNDGGVKSDDVTVTVKTSSTSTTNKLPVANAGSDRLIKLPTTGLYLTGLGSDPDGTVASYKWVQISGPRVSLSSATSAKAYVSGLVSGECVFRLTITDNNGATDYDDVKMVFSYAPVAYAGSDIRRTSKANFSIIGKGSDRDGTITNYLWSKTSGPGITMSGQSTPTLSLSNLVTGTYYFRLKVTDNTGLTHFDNMLVVIP